MIGGLLLGGVTVGTKVIGEGQWLVGWLVGCFWQNYGWIELICAVGMLLKMNAKKSIKMVHTMHTADGYGGGGEGAGHSVND